jgi:D-lactate dehydrogenase
MKIAFFSAKPFERQAFEAANQLAGHELAWFEERLHAATAPLAAGAHAVCVFVNDRVDADTIAQLARDGTRLILCRSAGYNHVDLAAAKEAGINVMRVPAYSPESVAEHAVGMVLSLVRNLHHQYNRVRVGNFSMDNIAGWTLRGKTAGIVGTGHIGLAMARILNGFGCTLLGTDPWPNPACEALDMRYVSRELLFAQSDIVMLATPLNDETRHMVNAESLRGFKRGSVLINVSRGALIDTAAVIPALKSLETIHYLGIDVYEEEQGLFFEDWTAKIVDDDQLQLLTTFKNCLITPHSAWLTAESLREIAETTLYNATGFARGRPDLSNEVSLPA